MYQCLVAFTQLSYYALFAYYSILDLIYIHVGVIYVIPGVLIRIAPKGSLIFRGENWNLSERSEKIIKIHYDVALGK